MLPCQAHHQLRILTTKTCLMTSECLQFFNCHFENSDEIWLVISVMWIKFKQRFSTDPNENDLD